jgi:hypothetical protein
VTLKTTGLFWMQHKTQNTTHTDTTTNKINCATLPSSSFAPSLSMGRAVVPPNHGAAATQRHAQAVSRWGCARCRWFACLGRQNKRHRIIERGGGALALGGRRFININNNQMEDGVNVRGCVGEEARPGRNVWGERLPVIWGGILMDKKIERWEDPWH